MFYIEMLKKRLVIVLQTKPVQCAASSSNYWSRVAVAVRLYVRRAQMLLAVFYLGPAAVLGSL